MPDKQVNLQRAWRNGGDGPGRPIMLAASRILGSMVEM